MTRKLQATLTFRLIGYPIGLGLTSVLVGGMLNRVMIVELGMPASLVGFFFAIPLLISPLRIWFGYRSDGYTLWGLRREPYIILGSLLAGLGIAIAMRLALGGSSTGLAIIGMISAMAVHHLGRNVASNTFEALLTDKFVGHRSHFQLICLFFFLFVFVGRTLYLRFCRNIRIFTLGVAKRGAQQALDAQRSAAPCG
jgi:MFS transporter, BCD family, chlorophyll transporter